MGLDGHPVLRRSLDDGEIADSGKRHVERARNRGRGEGQGVDAVPEPLEPFLVGDPEPLLLVDHQKAQVGEGHVLRKQAVGSDDDVDLARGEIGDSLLLLLAAPEAGEHLDPHRKRGEALLERGEVLERQDRRRHQHRDLLSVGDRLEGRAHRDFGLAVADVAADEPVHGRRRFHVPLHVLDRLLLIGGLLEGEESLELAHPGVVCGEGESGRRLALGVELEKLLSHVAHRLLDAPFDALPARPAELVESRPLPPRSSSTSPGDPDDRRERRACRRRCTRERRTTSVRFAGPSPIPRSFGEARRRLRCRDRCERRSRPPSSPGSRRGTGRA